MSYEQRDNSGALFKAEKKSEKYPDYTGKAVIGGQEYRISAWVRQGQSGAKFFSLSFQKPREEQSRQKVDPELNQDIPF